MQHTIVSQDEWLAARKAFLAKEKEFTKARDALNAARRALPWVKSRQEILIRWAERQANACRTFRRPQPVDRLSLHVRPGLGGRLPHCSFMGR